MFTNDLQNLLNNLADWHRTIQAANLPNIQDQTTRALFEEVVRRSRTMYSESYGPALALPQATGALQLLAQIHSENSRGVREIAPEGLHGFIFDGGKEALRAAVVQIVERQPGAQILTEAIEDRSEQLASFVALGANLRPLDANVVFPRP